MFKPERLLGFSDAVIAIAITILVLGLEVPSTHEVTEHSLHDYLFQTLRPFVGFVASFGLVGTYWLQHYVMFSCIERVDRNLVALNGFFLLCVTFVPFPTGLQAVYRDDELAFALYGATHAVCALALVAIWSYASTGYRLISADVSLKAIRSLARRTALLALVSTLSIGVSFLDLDVARVMFLAIPFLILSHRVIDRELQMRADEAREPAE
jgi:uncharacterized membrane protein